MRLDRHFVAVAAVGLTLGLAACNGGGGGSVPPIAANEPSLGKADAPVEFIEYASTACGHCAVFNNEKFHEFKAKHIDTGEVRYALREIITEPAGFAQASFLMARCAPPEKYYPIIDAVFASQMAIFQSRDLGGGLKQIALASGMSEADYQKCVTNEAALKALEQRVQKNIKDSKLEGTPTFFINGQKADFSAEVPMEKLSKAIADAKAKKK